MLDHHVPRGLEVRTGYYSKYPTGGKYLALEEYLVRDPNRAKQALFGRKLIARVRAHARPKRSR